MLLVIGAEKNCYELENVAALIPRSELELNKHRVDQSAVFAHGRMLGELT